MGNDRFRDFVPWIVGMVLTVLLVILQGSHPASTPGRTRVLVGCFFMLAGSVILFDCWNRSARGSRAGTGVVLAVACWILGLAAVIGIVGR